MLEEHKKFKKYIEDFTCEKCGIEVKGNGYTNHCHNCVWSKHVDVNPGDRASTCGGLMKPIKAEGSTNNFSIIHECVICGHTKKNKIGKDDSYDVIALVVKTASKDH